MKPKSEMQMLAEAAGIRDVFELRERLTNYACNDPHAPWGLSNSRGSDAVRTDPPSSETPTTPPPAAQTSANDRGSGLDPALHAQLVATARQMGIDPDEMIATAMGVDAPRNRSMQRRHAHALTSQSSGSVEIPNPYAPASDASKRLRPTTRHPLTTLSGVAEKRAALQSVAKQLGLDFATLCAENDQTLFGR